MSKLDRSNFYILSILFEEIFQFPGLPRLKRRRYARQCKLFCSFDAKFHVSNFAGRCSFRFIRVTAKDPFAIFMQLDFQAYNTAIIRFVCTEDDLEKAFLEIQDYTMYMKEYFGNLQSNE